MHTVLVGMFGLAFGISVIALSFYLGWVLTSSVIKCCVKTTTK